MIAARVLEGRFCIALSHFSRRGVKKYAPNRLHFMQGRATLCTDTQRAVLCARSPDIVPIRAIMTRHTQLVRPNHSTWVRVPEEER
jgi:hypothetical protein